jgi:hypothetical protein
MEWRGSGMQTSSDWFISPTNQEMSGAALPL